MRTWKTARILFAALAVAALAAAAMWPEPVEVDTVLVERGAMRVTVDEDGETRVRDRFVIAAPVTGHLQRIELEAGDPVVRDVTVVARIAPTDAPLLDARSRVELERAAEAARQVVGQARAERDRAAAARDRAAGTARRYADLVTAGAVSREDADNAQTALTTSTRTAQAAEFAVRRAEQELQLAEARLMRPPNRGRLIEVRSPVNGVVLKQHQESERVVAAGEALVDVGDPSSLEVVADLLSTDAVRVRPGDSVAIERWGGGAPLAARVQRVEPSGFLKISALGVEEQRVNVVVELDPSAAGCGLGDGYRVEARIVVWEAADAVTVPVGSLFRRGDGWAVFVADGNRARLRPIEIGERNNEVAQVAGGVAAGEDVILHPPDTLEDGARIRRRR
jgi:HlyD family secretion protein